MPRSQKKKISDILAEIGNDENLQHKFAELILSAIEDDSSFRNKLTKIVSEELANELRRQGL